MKKYLPAFPLLLLLAGCLKGEENTACNYDECAAKAPASEISSVQGYLSGNGLTAEQHCSGLFFAIDQQGTGTKAGACNTVALRYEGRLTNGTVFDSSARVTPVEFSLAGVVPGFRNGLMQMRPGSKARLYIPPSLGYGNQPRGPIPANSILVFNVELIGVR